ncbi:cell cycle checkpoint protein RAD17 [Lactuca sativa]|uniref:AAA+ ATPase domain-containing protein n=1 Tax=Lactuca sativa TaxID=4236 RepID=A0A9R1W270_LACSA|nr:cell cycle checkpoint protein RAD17 [Lactuca sativa]KAJ0218392.1 hypothetical protein LSAT_V11C300129350 [Lactuca sativa]
MGKRETIVLSSSEDDGDCNDNDFASKSILKYFKQPKSGAASVPRTNTKGPIPKKARISSSRSHPGKSSNPFDEMKEFCEDFGEGFTGFKVSAGHKRDNKELWVDKYKPRSLLDLSVHKKKVEEIKIWLEERIKTKNNNHYNHVLVITGLPGVGKSATVEAIASHLGVTVYEWNTPTPTIWQEHIHTTNAGLRYMSKLDEFENFVEKIRKYGLISSSLTKEPQKKPFLILIDDLPVTNGKISYGRLQRCLHLLVQYVCVPTIILITDYGRSDTADYTSRCWEELQTSLQNAGAFKVAFNPITANSITKMLSRICREEKLKTKAEQIDAIAKASGGDIRNAITSLQYFNLKSNSKGIFVNSNCLDDGYSLSCGRDETLSLFHALGKFLHNKRETEKATTSDSLKEEFTRLPMKMDVPEKVLGQAHGQARPIADFLHENVLDFVEEEGIDDAWVVASYLSDADSLLASLNGIRSRSYEAENLIQSTAASVAVRGVMFGNRHPLSSRWHAIRRPVMWQVEQSQWRNKKEMIGERCVGGYNGVSLSDLSVIATEWKPVSKWLGGSMVDNNDCDLDHFEEICDDDDEIEDW